MKKILFCFTVFLISIGAKSQTYQTNVTFNAYSWAVMSGIYTGSDSTGFRFERKLRNAVQAVSPIANYNVNITVDTVPNSIIIWIYHKYKSFPGSWQTAMGTSIPTVVDAMVNSEIVAARNTTNAMLANELLMLRNIGKNENIDQ